MLEHVQDDRRSAEEMVRTLRPGGRLAIFAPNCGYPFETHGIHWRGRYHFGNIPLVKRNFTLVTMVIIVISVLPGVVEFLRHRRSSRAASGRS